MMRTPIIKSSNVIRVISIITLYSLSFVALAFLSGCSGMGFGRGGSSDDTVSIGTDFHTGSEGIKMRFLEKAPPPVLYDSPSTQSNEIIVLLELWNKGAFNTEATLFLGGFDQQIIGLPFSYGNGATIDLMGKSIYNSEGEQRVVQFPYDNIGGLNGWINLPPESDRYSPDLQATVCYPYETFANPNVCVSWDPYKITSEQVCTPGTVKGTLGSQGAPVAVTGVSAENIPGEVIFKIRVSNVGQGRVLDYSAWKRCPYNLDYLDMNRIEYSVQFGSNSQNFASIGGGGGSNYCQPDVLRLSGNNGVIYCRFSITDQSGAFQRPLRINLRYGYMDSIRKHVEIKNLNPSGTG